MGYPPIYGQPPISPVTSTYDPIYEMYNPIDIYIMITIFIVDKRPVTIDNQLEPFMECIYPIKIR